MLEARCGRHTGGCFELFHKLPAVECIEKIDVTGSAVNDFEWEFSVFHIDSGRLLVGIATIFQSEFFHFGVN